MEKIPFLKGVEAFKKYRFKEYEEKFRELIEKGQKPKALFITCSDSRIHPDEITGADIGDLFIVRNIGNMVPPFKPDNEFHGVAAAIEYAVSVLNVPDIIVCGHSHCGACESLYKDLPDDPEIIHVKKWLEIDKDVKEVALSAVKEKGRKLFELTERLNIIKQLENLLSYPGVKRRVKEGTLRLHGWYYIIEMGEIEYYNPEKNQFEPVVSS
ncbi:carbonic anhydrase [Persephonella atlantica]|uniref:Carbonic anhydrase n=1 Tax=Persephonella atlantica TaxID=2699429 RepID=A0ABS1GK26_9AQUI|nr:carbonic anhydrase [Persephonella atlantica]MBK3333087.1 carbonic anhydrase [Persephonella atlantica]